MANRILVVDDNSDIRENICEYLNLRGHQTIGASEAASAAQLIAEEDIALIVLDVGLPGEDGMSFCRRLRLAGSSILILMLTARDAVDDRVAGLSPERTITSSNLFHCLSLMPAWKLFCGVRDEAA